MIWIRVKRLEDLLSIAGKDRVFYIVRCNNRRDGVECNLTYYYIEGNKVYNYDMDYSEKDNEIVDLYKELDYTKKIICKTAKERADRDRKAIKINSQIAYKINEVRKKLIKKIEDDINNIIRDGYNLIEVDAIHQKV